MARVTVDVKIRGKSGAQRAMRKLIAGLEGAPLQAAVLEGAKAIEDATRPFVPVDSGALRGNLRSEAGGG